MRQLVILLQNNIILLQKTHYKKYLKSNKLKTRDFTNTTIQILRKANKMQEDWDFEDLNNKADYERKSQKNDSIGNNSGGARSQRNQDFDLLDDGYQQKMQQKQIKLQQMKDEQQQQLLYGPSNKPQLQNNKQPQISVLDIEQHLSSKTVSILTYKNTLQTIIQYVNAFSLDELKKFIRLVLDIPGFNEAFEGKEQNKKDRKGNKVNKMQMQEEEENLLNSQNDISSNISAKSFPQQKKESGYTLPSNGVQTIMQIICFLSSMIDKCTSLQNSHLQQIIRQLLETNSRFYSLPLRPQQLISEISQFVQNTVSQKKYEEVQENVQNAYVSLFQFSDSVDELKEIFYFLLASRCVNNCFRKETKQNRLSVKMKINCMKLLNQLEEGSQEYFNKFGYNKQLQNYTIPHSQLNKLNKQQLQDYSMIVFTYSHKSQQKLALYIDGIVYQLISSQSSIDKKCLGFKLIDKMILNTKLYPSTTKGCLQFLEKNEIMSRFMNDTTHSQLLRKLPPIVKFLYEQQKVTIKQIKHLVESVMKSHQQFYKVVLSLVHYLSIEHLQQLFQYITQHLISKHQPLNELNNPHIAGIIMNIVNNVNLTMINKKKDKKSHINHSLSNKKQQQLRPKDNNNYQMQLTNNNAQNNSYSYLNGINGQLHHPIVYELFHFLFNLLPQPHIQQLYTPIFCKHLSLQLPLLLPLLQQQLTNKLCSPKNYQPYIISILEYLLKLDIDNIRNEFSLEKKKIIQQNQQTVKYQFINNLVVNCNLYDSIMFILCKKRFDKTVTQKCLNILVLATKSYKQLEKNHIELLWKILGLHSTNQFEKQQFFQFTKQLIKNSINLTQESVKHIYFQIILKLHYDWFTPKIYDCFQMLFIRLNEDGKLLTYQNLNNNNNLNTSPVYHLNQTQLVGLEKFYYLYFWSQAKVSKKVKDLVFKLYNYKSSPQTKQKLSYEIIHTVMSYLLRNPQSQDHPLHAIQEKDYEQHLMRGFELFLKFIDSKVSGQIGENQQAIITVMIHNVTRQALPPLKKSLQVNKNMLLKQFKQLIRKQINPPINDIQLINKGKPLKVQRMSLKQLKIQSKNTILVQNMDQHAQRKESEQIKLKQSKQTLRLVFSQQYSVQLLDYIAEKYLGQQLEKICQWIMDEDKMKQIQTQYKQKKSAKIQQEKQIIIPKKKYSTDTNQMLTFGQILSKQIQVLLRIIPVKQALSKKYLIDKQWQVIKKMPFNVQIARKISSELEKQHVNFEKIFEINNNINSMNNNSSDLYESLNLGAYLWYIVNRIISRKPDQYRNKLVGDKGLQLFIVGQLQRLMCQQKYCYELYYQLIQAHEVIIQGIGNKREVDGQSVSMFGLLRQQKSDKLNNNNMSKEEIKSEQINLNPCNIVGKMNQVIKGHVRFNEYLEQQERRESQSILFSNLKQVQQSVLNMINNLDMDQVIVEKLLSFLLFDLIQQHNLQQYVGFSVQELNTVKMDKKQLNLLLIRYREPLLKFYISLKLLSTYDRSYRNTYTNQNQQSQRPTQQSQRPTQQSQRPTQQSQRPYHFVNDYLQVRHLIMQAQQSLSQQPKQWLYFLMVGSIQLIQKQFKVNNHQYENGIMQTFQSDLIYFTSLLTHNYNKIPKNELIALLAIINKLIQFLLLFKYKQNNHLFANNQQQQLQQQSPQMQRIIIILQQFIQFLTREFIYQIKGVPILTSNLIKQLFYQILYQLSSFNQQLFIKITDKIIKFDVLKRNHDHDNIQFRKSQFVGIQNLGCTCYINSLIQQLYHTRLPYKLLTLKNQEGLFELNHTFMQLYMSTKNAINIKPMIQQVKFYGQQIIPNIQQDVQQFLMSLLDYIESCNGRSIIDSIFGGSYSEELTYFSQKQQNKLYKKHKQQHFYNITLDIKGKKTLNQALTYFFRSQQLDDKIYCQELNQKTTVIKRSFIKHFPKILIFTLKRFQFDMENMVRNKLNDYLQFPMELDLLDFSLEKFIKEQQQERKMEIQNDGIEGNQSQQKQRIQEQQSHNYQLCGILIHSGSAQTGHYYSYVQREKKWFEFNDRVVSEINLGQKIKGECFGGSSGGDSKSRNAYMLFYEKIEKNRLENDKKNTLIGQKIIDKNTYRVQKMQIEQNDGYQQYKMIDQKEHQVYTNQQNQQQQQQYQNNKLLIHQRQQQIVHHGIFLSQVPQDNFFKQLVKDENNHFIKQRLIYDVEYRKFVQLLTSKVKQIVGQESKKEHVDLIKKRVNSLLTDKLKKLQKINDIINPKQQKPIVHFVNNDLMEIEQIKQSQFLQSKKAKNSRDDDFLQDLIQGRQENNDFI